MTFRSLILALVVVLVPAAASATRCPNELPVLFVVQDKSGTMAEAPDASCTTCPSKWRSSKDAVVRLSSKYANRFRFGLQMFPHDTTTFNCTTGTTVAPFPADTTAITAAYTAAAPGGGTPTAVSLDAAATYLKGLKLTEPAYVLLLTDGLPNCNLALDPATCSPSQPACAAGACGAKGCLDDSGARSAAARLKAAGFKVYVLGFDGVAGANNNKPVLDGIAASGGTTASYVATDPATLDTALNAIAFDASTCCKDMCTQGAAQCTAAGEVRQCKLDTASGCTNWTVTACAAKSTCLNGVCQSCQDQCTVNATRCEGSKAQKCTVAANGCTAWTVTDNCDWGELCTAGTCASCGTCTAGQKRCAGNSVEKCEADLVSGCTRWITSSCSSGSVCVNGACSGCSGTCTAGQKRCSGATPETCVADASGCTSWRAGNPCNDFCSGGACGVCGTSCTVGATRCNGNSIEMCTTDSNKCTVWTSNGPCLDGQFCSGGSCQTCPTRCTSGERQCTAKGIIECQVQSSGCSEWVSVGGCNNGELCQEGACIPPCTNECTGGAVACDDQGKPRKCEKVASGCTVWRAAPECEGEDRCVEGVCRTRCYGGEIETCDPGFVCTGLPEGNLCLPGGDPDPVDPGPGTDPGLEEPNPNPGTNPKPGNNASEAGAAGCGCASAQAPLLAGLAPLALGLLRRRRRG